MIAQAAGAQDPPRPVVVNDRADARTGAPDLKRVAASRTADGRLRFALSLVSPLSPRALLADADDGGPPGSICVRLWTVSTPRTTPPDLLTCVTALTDGRTLRATISREVPGQLPATVGRAELTRPSRTSLVLRLPRGITGTARRVVFAAEATRAGCPRSSCVDLAPNAGRTRTLAVAQSE